jgi:hypothetical protein
MQNKRVPLKKLAFKIFKISEIPFCLFTLSVINQVSSKLWIMSMENPRNYNNKQENKQASRRVQLLEHHYKIKKKFFQKKPKMPSQIGE